jgi:hypothetical protein
MPTTNSAIIAKCLRASNTVRVDPLIVLTPDYNASTWSTIASFAWNRSPDPQQGVEGAQVTLNVNQHVKRGGGRVWNSRWLNGNAYLQRTFPKFGPRVWLCRRRRCWCLTHDKVIGAITPKRKSLEGHMTLTTPAATGRIAAQPRNLRGTNVH